MLNHLDCENTLVDVRKAKGMMVGGDGMGWFPLVGREGECLGQSEGWNWQEAHTLPDSLSLLQPGPKKISLLLQFSTLILL